MLGLREGRKSGGRNGSASEKPGAKGSGLKEDMDDTDDEDEEREGNKVSFGFFHQPGSSRDACLQAMPRRSVVRYMWPCDFST